MNNFQEFIDEHQEETECHQVNLTGDQVAIINKLSDTLELSFADTVLMLVELQLNDIGHAWIAQTAVKN